MMLYRILTIACCFLLVGCSAEQVEPNEKFYRVSPRQLPPEPVYNRLRWVHLPETHPTRDMHLLPTLSPDRPRLMPIVHFTIKDKPLCEAAVMLAGLGRYTSYCSSLLKEQQISLDALGTMDELAQLIQSNHPVQVIIDHENREVRFLASSGIGERFFEEEVVNEHQ